MLIYISLSSFHAIFDESEMSQSVSQLVSEGEGIDMNIWIWPWNIALQEY